MTSPKIDKQSTFKLARWAAWAAGGVAALWALGWLAVPPLLKSQVEKIASQALGRQVTIGTVDFKPWTLELTVNDLAVAPAPGQTASAPQLAVKRIYVDAELQSILRLAPVVDALTVEAPHLRLTHLGDGHYDIDDVLAKLNEPSPTDSGVVKFALYNLELSQGAVDFNDQAVGKTHELRKLQINLPFLSTLDSQRTVQVQPKLAFSLNGTQFDSSAQGTPFAQTHKTDASFRVDKLDLRPYLGYWPATLPVRLGSAILSANLKVAFEQTPNTLIRLSGLVQADQVQLTKAGGAAGELLTFDHLGIQVDDARPLDKRVKLSSIELTQARVNVVRNRAGLINLLQLGDADAPTKAPSAQAAPTPDAKAANKGADAEPMGGWQVQVGEFKLAQSQVDWTDELSLPVARLALHEVNLKATAIVLPLREPVALSGNAQLTAVGQAAHATLSFEGQGSDAQAQLHAKLAGLPLAMGAPYLAQFLVPTVSGLVDAELALHWMAAGNTAGSGSQADEIRLEVAQASVNDLALTQGKLSVLSLKQLQFSQVQLNVGQQTASLGKVLLSQPKTTVRRDEQGHWMYEAWLKDPPAAPPPAKVAAQTKGQAPKAWALTVVDAAVEGGSVGYVDDALPKPVELELTGLTAHVKNFSTQGGKPFQTDVATQVHAGLPRQASTGGKRTASAKGPRADAGRLAWHGTVGLSPLVVRGTVDASRLPAHVLEPYVADALNIELLRAQASFKGQVNFAQTTAGNTLKLTGDTAVEDFHANSVATAQGDVVSGAADKPSSPLVPAAAAAATPASPASAATATTKPVAGQARGEGGSEELLSWKALSLRGLDVAMAPGAPTRVSVRETVLSDFFARIILSRAGRLNLQDVLRSDAAEASAVDATTAQPTPPAPPGAQAATVATSNTPVLVASNALTTRASGQKDPKSDAEVQISFGPIALTGGRVNFSDRFIQPNYSTALTELNGKLSAFSSVAHNGVVNLADLELRGRAEGTAALEVVGKVNPLAKPLALDIKGKVRDLELSPLSPYSIHYAGYGIERGKMSVDVSYLIKPDGQLTASNNIVLNQLTFGNKVEGAPNSLPVKLAVALLADSNGVIDINLPVSGSLSDPQFRIGPIVFKLIVNLVVKAITSPFTLLASAFGGGAAADQLGNVAFVPGSATLALDAKPGLEKVAKALTARPALKLTVVGTASLEAEREAYQREQLRAQMKAEKRRTAVVGGASVEDIAKGDSEVISEAEYPVLLKAVYKRASFPKPRNLVGLAKDLPPADMEALLLTHVSVTDEAMQALAQQRGVVVRDYLAQLQIPSQRLFLGAAKAVAPDPKWSPRAELNLATQ